MEQLTRIAVKIGSNVLTRKDGTLDITQMSALVDQIARLHKSGIEVILISSGAVAAGRSEIYPSQKLDSVDQRQLFSAIGQVKLINRYYELFREHHIKVGQVLTMKECFSTRRHYLNQKNCMTVMLENQVIPIVNENDTVSVSELMFTDNDELSGLIATMMQVQALIILSNVGGLYTGNPDDPEAEIIEEIPHGTDVSAYIQPSKSSAGRGGMKSKASIARKVADEGIKVILSDGRKKNILIRILEKEASPDTYPQLKYTRFIPAEAPTSNVKRWIAHSEGFAKGELHINKATQKALTADQAASLLPIGITAVTGNFEKDDIVRIVNDKGKLIGVGKANYSSQEAKELMGQHGKKPVIHYDYLYIE